MCAGLPEMRARTPLDTVLDMVDVLSRHGRLYRRQAVVRIPAPVGRGAVDEVDV